MEELHELSFTPHDDDTLSRLACPITEGEATGVVVEEKFGNNGNPWLLLTFEATDNFGKKAKIKDFFSLADKDLWRFKKFCEAANRPDVYAKGKINIGDCIGIAVSVETEWRKTGKYPGMKIAEYLASQLTAKTLSNFYSKKEKTADLTAELKDDDIPF